MKKIFQWFNKLEEAVLCFLIGAMTLLVFVEVILRFGFNYGMIWAQELTLYIAAWFVLFGASYGIKTGAHIGVDAFVKLLPTLHQRIIGLIGVVLCFVYCGLFLYGGWVYLSKMKLIGIEMEDLPIPKWQATSVLFLGFVLLAIRFFQLTIKILTGQANGFKFTNEAKQSMTLAENKMAD